MPTRSVVLTRSAAWMADWSSYTDEIDHQDPEVAIGGGYRDMVLPLGSLSAVGVLPELVDRLSDPDLERRWQAGRPLVAGEQLVMSTSTGDGVTSTSFAAGDGEEVGREVYTAMSSAHALSLPNRTPAFRTGPIDRTRLRALAWGLGTIDPSGPGWRWGEEPAALLHVLARFVLPGLVAVRGALWGHAATESVREVTCRPIGSVIEGERLSTWIVDRPDGFDATVAAQDRPIAAVAIETQPAVDLTRARWPGHAQQEE